MSAFVAFEDPCSSMVPDATASVIQQPMDLTYSVSERPATPVPRTAPPSNLVTSYRMGRSHTDLPPELLSEIFLIYHSSYTCLPGYRPWWDRCWHSYRWMAITHVCRHWRTVALATPLLWGTLILAAEKAYFDYIPTNSLRVQEFLRRSRDAPLHVSVDIPDRGSLEIACVSAITQNLMLIIPYAHRLESLHVSYRIGGSGFRTLSRVLRDAPLLRSLTFRRGRYIEYSSSDDVPLISSTGALSHLERLDVEGFASVKVMPFFRSTLKYLTIENNMGSVSSAVLLDCMSNMLDLETLRVSGISPNLQDAANAFVFPNATLSHLQRLGLSGLPYPCAEVLSHFCFPASAALEIEVNTTAIGDREDGNHQIIQVVNISITAAIAAKLQGQGIIGDPEMLPSHLDITPSSMKLYEIKPNVDDPDSDSDLEYANRRSPKLQFKLDWAISRPCGPLPYYQLALPTPNRIHVLTVTEPNFLLWEPYLALLGGVESLILRGESLDYEDHDGLAILKMPRPTPIFPLLRVLRLKNYKFRDCGRQWHSYGHNETDGRSLSNIMESILESRRNAGIGIKTLVIDWATNMWSTDAAKF